MLASGKILLYSNEHLDAPLGSIMSLNINAKYINLQNSGRHILRP